MGADYRSVHTRMWREDEWFVELDAEARLFWIYLFTNPSAGPAGIYRLSLRTAASECGIPLETAQRLMAQFSEANKAHYEDGVIWVVNMRRLQFPGIVDGSREWQTAVRIGRDIDAIPDRISLKHRYLMAYGYPTVDETKEDQKTIRRVLIKYPSPIDTPSIPHRYPIGETETVTETVTERETESAQAPSADADTTHPPVPASLAGWQELLKEDKANRPAILRRMFDTLYPDAVDVPAYSYLGKVANQIGGAGRLAELLWLHSTKPPSGDVLAYIQAQSKAVKSAGRRNGNDLDAQGEAHARRMKALLGDGSDGE